MLDPVQHEKLPFALSFFGLELPAVQAPDQLQDESVIDIGVLDLVVRVDDHLGDPASIDREVHPVASALPHLPHNSRGCQS